MNDSDIHAVRDLASRMAEAERTFNAAFFQDALAEDAVIMPPNIPATVGKAACLEFVRSTLFEVQQLFERKTFSHVSDEIVVLGDTAFDRGTYESSLMPKAGGDAEEERGQYLRIFARGPDGSWRVSRVIWNMFFPPEPEEESATQ